MFSYSKICKETIYVVSSFIFKNETFITGKARPVIICHLLQETIILADYIIIEKPNFESDWGSRFSKLRFWATNWNSIFLFFVIWGFFLIIAYKNTDSFSFWFLKLPATFLGTHSYYDRRIKRCTLSVLFFVNIWFLWLITGENYENYLIYMGVFRSQS